MPAGYWWGNLIGGRKVDLCGSGYEEGQAVVRTVMNSPFL